MAGPVGAVKDGVRVAVRVSPGAAQDRVTGLQEDAGGECVLKVAVTAAPEGGKANAALVKLLAKSWGVPKSAITIVKGRTERRKTLHVAGDAGHLKARLDSWLQELSG